MTLLVLSPVCLIMATVALLLHHRAASPPPLPTGALPLVNDLPGCVCDEQAETALLVEEQ